MNKLKQYRIDKKIENFLNCLLVQIIIDLKTQKKLTQKLHQN